MSVPRASFPDGISPADGWRLATERAGEHVRAIRRASLPLSDEFGCMHRDALLALVRRGLTSDNLVELEATRQVLRIAQEALVRFLRHPDLCGARRDYLGEE